MQTKTPRGGKRKYETLSVYFGENAEDLQLVREAAAYLDIPVAQFAGALLVSEARKVLKERPKERQCAECGAAVKITPKKTKRAA